MLLSFLQYVHTQGPCLGKKNFNQTSLAAIWAVGGRGMGPGQGSVELSGWGCSSCTMLKSSVWLLQWRPKHPYRQSLLGGPPLFGCHLWARIVCFFFAGGGRSWLVQSATKSIIPSKNLGCVVVSLPTHTHTHATPDLHCLFGLFEAGDTCLFTRSGGHCCCCHCCWPLPRW